MPVSTYDAADDLASTVLEGAAGESDTIDAEDEPFSDPSEADPREFGLYQQLPIPEGEPDFESGEPDDAEEYLRRVRYEAAQLPRVVTAKIDPRDFDAQRTQYVPSGALPEAIELAMPEKRWLQSILTEFALLRLQIQQAEEDGTHEESTGPSGRDSLSWRNYCFGKSSSPAASTSSPQPGAFDSRPHLPSLPALLTLDKTQAEVLFQRHVDWLVCSKHPPEEQHMLWLYALAARLEKPLAARTSAQLRSLLRHCACLRADVLDAADPLLPHLNVMIAIAGAYFGQDEALASQGTDELP
ncbi:hypothetical protein WJX72_004382 [[Myrmecia] bisecta]|uniref:Gem-associated protein 2 n=1 Tax=[Myrmecia] bisecta TaxID=41462 RepID=A0AAW1PQA7_9CHLO